MSNSPNKYSSPTIWIVTGSIINSKRFSSPIYSIQVHLILAEMAHLHRSCCCSSVGKTSYKIIGGLICLCFIWGLGSRFWASPWLHLQNFRRLASLVRTELVVYDCSNWKLLIGVVKSLGCLAGSCWSSGTLEGERLRLENPQFIVEQAVNVKFICWIYN